MSLIKRLEALGFSAWKVGKDFYRVDGPGFHAALDGAMIVRLLDAAEGDK